jgi:competence protein ComEC
MTHLSNGHDVRANGTALYCCAMKIRPVAIDIAFGTTKHRLAAMKVGLRALGITRVAATFKLHTLAVVLVLVALTVPIRSQAARGLDVYWIDVEGGAATLIVTPAGESVLVDAGNPGGRDPGRIAKTAKEIAHLARLDYLVVTHLHNDHFGGVAELAGLVPIGTLYENGIESAPATEQAQATVAAYRTAAVSRRVAAQPGDTIPLKQSPGAARVTLRILSARQTIAPSNGRRSPQNAAICKAATEKSVDTTDNANSIAMLLEAGDFRMFLGGDTTWNVEARLVCPDDRVGKVDVYQSVHHGLDLSNNPVLVRTLQPHVVVFNNGARKGFEKNTVATVSGLASVQAIYQVHRALADGAANTADERIANREQACAGEGIAMTVAPDGKSYTIKVPSTGHSKTYRTGH